MRMLNVLVCGVCGKMGGNVCDILRENKKMRVVCGVDKRRKILSLPVYSDFSEVKEDIDVVIDFSSPAVLKEELEWAIMKDVPVVLAPTGYSAEDSDYIQRLSEHIAIFRTANFSFGINLLLKLVREASETLGDSFDAEIVEKHHRMKTDAPSGTALMLADCIKEACGGTKQYVFGREGQTGARGNEIGVHSVRGGTIVGEHEVIFAGEEEIITLSHCALSKKIFADGAVKAAEWIIGKPSGLYGMDDLTESL